jgi:hypothetical protein
MGVHEFLATIVGPFSLALHVYIHGFIDTVKRDARGQPAKEYIIDGGQSSISIFSLAEHILLGDGMLRHMGGTARKGNRG